MKKHTPKVRHLLKQVMKSKENCIESKDRVSLIKYATELRRTFSLVEKNSNFSQLRNQIEKLKFDEDQSMYYYQSGHDDMSLFQVLVKISREFKKHQKGLISSENGPGNYDAYQTN